MEADLTPEQKFNAEAPGTMVPRALLQGKSRKDVVKELTQLDWEQREAEEFVERAFQDYTRFSTSLESRAALIRECWQQFCSGMMIAGLGAIIAIATYVFVIGGALYIWIFAAGMILVGLVRANRGHSRWQIYRPSSLPLQHQIDNVDLHPTTTRDREVRPLVISFISLAGACGGIVTVMSAFTHLARQIGEWYPPALLFSAAIGLICMYGLWKMKRWSVYLYTIFCIAAQVTLAIAGLWSPLSILFPGIIITVSFCFLNRMV